MIYRILYESMSRPISNSYGKVTGAHIDKLAKKYLGQDIYPNRRPGEVRGFNSAANS